MLPEVFKPPHRNRGCGIPSCYPRRGVLYETSANQLFHHAAVYIGEPHVAPGVKVGKQRVIETHQVQGGRMQIVYVDLILYGGIAEIVRSSEGLPTFHAGAGHPAREATGI